MTRLTSLVSLALLVAAWPGLIAAELVDRGNGMVYDTTLDITWLQDAGLGGDHNRDDAVSLAEDLVFGGYCDWRLPRIEELEHMYFVNLNGTTGDNLTGDQGAVRDIQPVHWSSSTGRDGIRAFDFRDGQILIVPWGSLVYHSAWAVKSGDVATSPSHFQIETQLVIGWLETDGTLGTLSAENILDWDLTMHFSDFDVQFHRDMYSDVTITGTSALSAHRMGLHFALVFDFDTDPATAFSIGFDTIQAGPIPPPGHAGFWLLTNGRERVFYGVGNEAWVERASHSGSVALNNLSGQCDVDLDQIPHDDDNCAYVANSLQVDTNGDGIGNRCDFDIAGLSGSDADDCYVNFHDLGAFKRAFMSDPTSGNWDPEADFTGPLDQPDQRVDFLDLNLLRNGFLEDYSASNPSGVANNCSP